MALTILYKASIEILERGIASHQGDEETGIDEPIEVATTVDAAAEYSVPFSATTAVTIWDKDDAHGLTTLTMLWVKSTRDGMLEIQTTGEAANDDVNSISIRSGCPVCLFATDVTDILQAYDDITGADALGTGTLDNVTKVRFKDTSGNAGNIEVIAAK